MGAARARHHGERHNSAAGQNLRNEESLVAHAVALRVSLPGDSGEGLKMLDEHVIPAAKALTGSQRGTWMHQVPSMIGTAVIVFDSEANATAAVPALQPPPGGPTVVRCEVFEVAREA